MKWVILLLTALESRLVYAEIDPTDRLIAQARIEEEVIKLLRTQLAPEEFLVVVALDLEEINGASTNKEKNVKNSKETLLPYLTFKADPQKIKNIEKYASDLNSRYKIRGMKVDVTFDERIPESKRKVLEQSLNRKLNPNNGSRILTISTVALVSESIADQLKMKREESKKAAPSVSDMTAKEKFDINYEKVKLEVAKKDIEIERGKLEQTREIVNIESKMKELESKLRLAEQATFDEKRKLSQSPPPVAATGRQPQSPLDEISKLQTLLAVGLFSVIVFFSLMMGSGAFKKGMGNLSDGFGKIGLNIKEAVLAVVDAQKAALKQKNDALAAITREKESGGGLSADGVVPKGHENQAGAPQNEAERQKFEEFMTIVQDKIEILARDKNFSLYREIQDFVDSDQSLPLASALLLNLSREATIELLKGLNPAHIDRLKRYMANPGAVQESKALRHAAFQEFYGRIVVEEFSDSPIMKLNDLGWLLKLNNTDLAKAVAEISGSLRPAFLACLSPTRVKKILESAVEVGTKKAIVKAAVEVGAVKDEDFEKLLNELTKMRSKKESNQAASGLVDRARYLSKLAETLNDEDQKILLEEIGRKEEVQKDFAKYYVPFSAIGNLPKEIILEIFGERPDNQVALMLFAADEKVRQAVIKALPEIRAATVLDELKLLDSQSFYKKRNEKQSIALQRTVSNYLLKLKEEGLLDDNIRNLRVVNNAA